jgi:hypothetical protein
VPTSLETCNDVVVGKSFGRLGLSIRVSHEMLVEIVYKGLETKEDDGHRRRLGSLSRFAI